MTQIANAGAGTVRPNLSAVVTGYWLAAVPGRGFGIVHGAGPLGGTAHARYLGSTRSQMTGNLHGAVSQLHAEQVYEVANGTGAMIDQALRNGSAWATGPASVSWDTLPTKILVALVGAGAGLSIFGAAGAAAGAGAGEAAGAGATAAGEAATAGSTAAAGAGGAAAGGVASKAASAAGKLLKGGASAVAKNPLAAAGVLSVAGLFTNVSWWKGASMCVAGGVLVILAVRELT